MDWLPLVWVFLLLANGAQGASYLIEEKSDPVGFIVKSTPINSGAVYTSTAAALTINTYQFAYWTLNGVRQHDSAGRSVNPLVFTPTADATLTAVYLVSTFDGDNDGLLDVYELTFFGGLTQNSLSDGDADGFSVQLEMLLGFHPGLFDLVVDGGFSRRSTDNIDIQINQAYYLVTAVSDPPGLVGPVVQFAIGTTQVTLPTPVASVVGNNFVGWYAPNGTRADSPGTKQPAVVSVSEATTFTARYASATIDADFDTLLDWYEWFSFSSLSYTSTSDPDSDGLSILVEQILGFSPFLLDTIADGGISRRASDLFDANLAGYYSLQIASNPAGLQAGSLAWGAPSTSVETPNLLNVNVNGYRFVGWDVNGVRVVDSTGASAGKVSVTLNGNKTATAQFILDTLDNDADGIADWLETFYTGSLLGNSETDADIDGFTFAIETLLGFHPRLVDTIRDGGISRRSTDATAASANIILNWHPEITVQPAPVSVLGRTSFSLTVGVSSYATATYQWRKDGIAISGGTSATYNVISAKAADAGVYDVLVSDNYGTTASSPAIVNVTVYRLASGVLLSGGSSIVDGGTLTLNSIREGSAFGLFSLDVKNGQLADGFSEKLDFAVGMVSGGAVATGGGSLLAAGSVSGGALSVGLAGGTYGLAGKQSGRIAVNFTSDGMGTSNLGTIAAGSQTLNIVGNVYRLAVGTIASGTVTLDSVREGAEFVAGPVSVSNIAAVDGFSEKLNVSLSVSGGAATVTSGTVNLLSSGNLNASTLSVSLLGTATAGLKVGTVLAAYASDGVGTSGLANLSAGSQTLIVRGAVYRQAAGVLSQGSLNLGNIRAGGTFSVGSLSLTNTAVADGFSDLLGVVGSAAIGFSVSGGTGALSAGTQAGWNIGYTGDVSTAGVKSGTVNFALTSMGQSGTGLSTVVLGTQGAQVSATVYRAAVGGLVSGGSVLTSGGTLTLAAVREGGVFGGIGVGVKNTQVADLFSEKLNATVSSVTGLAQGTGSALLVSAGSIAPGALTVTLSGTSVAVAGRKNGAVNAAFQTDGSGSSGLGVLSAGTQTLNLQGNVYRLAVGSLLFNTVSLGNIREGGVFTSQAVRIRNVATGDFFSDDLAASLTTSGSSFTAFGSLTRLAAGRLDISSLQVGFNGSTVSAGAFSGTAQVDYVSKGQIGSGLDDVAPLKTSESLSLSGTIYRQAALALESTVVDLGRVRLGSGSLGSGTLAFANGAQNDGFSDVLQVTTTATGLLSVLNGSGTYAAGSGAVMGVSYAGADLGVAGLKTGSLNFGLVSRGQTGTGLASLVLSAQTVQVQGVVYNGQSVWNGGASGSWLDWTKWSVAGGRPGMDGLASIASGDTATFKTGSLATSVTLPGEGSMLNLAALSLNGTGGVLLSGGGTIALSGVSGTVYAGANGIQAAGGDHIVNADVLLMKATTALISEATLTLNGLVAGANASAGLLKAGSGRLVLAQGLSNLGSVQVNAGILEVGATLGSIPGAQEGSVSPGSTQISIGVAGSLVLGADQQIATLSGSGGLILQGGNLTLAGLADSAFGGVISGSGSLSKTGSATLTLSGANSYSGTNTVNSGTLLLSGSSTTSGAVFVRSGASLGGSGTTLSSVTVASGGILSPGSSMVPAKLTLGGLTLSGGSNLNFRLNTQLNSDGIVVSGADGFSLSGSNTIKLSLSQGVNYPAVGTYTLIAFNGSSAPESGLKLAATTLGGYDAKLVWTSNAVSVVLTPSLTRVPSRSVFGAGESVTLAVGSFSAAVTLQWAKNGEALPGAIGSVLNLGSLSAEDEGAYEARITQGGQTTVIEAGSISVVSITEQPQSRSVAQGGSVTFSVGAISSAPLSFEWLKGGSLVMGGTGSALAVWPVDANSIGNYSANVWSGTFKLSSVAAALRLLPVIGGTLTASARVGEPFAYQISASNSPSKFGAESLPGGLSVNEATGVISGLPQSSGATNVTLLASNATGSDASAGTATLVVNVSPQAPAIFNTLNGFATVGQDFSYQILATNSPTSFTATNLPSGLTLNATTGLISGTPTAYTLAQKVTITASNNGGTGAGAVLFSVNALPPEISSALVVQAAFAQPLAYQIAATNVPTGYAVTNLPSGLSFDSVTGSVSGSPTASGDFVVVLEAYNKGGTGRAKLALRVLPPLPVINSPLAASARVNSAFIYGITASNNPTQFAASSLPAWLSFDSTRGVLTGKPLSVGTVSIRIEAINAGGTGTAQLLLNVTAQPVAPALSVVQGLTVPVATPFKYAVQASNNPVSYTAKGLPEGILLDANSGILSGTPTVVGVYAIELGATNEGGTGSSVFNVKVVPPAPVVGGELAASATAGSSFRYQISATNQPKNYATGVLPAGLVLNSLTGLINGTPLSAGSASFALSATNDGGTGNATLVLNVLPPAPVLPAVLKAFATAGAPFSYLIPVRNAVSQFTAQNLPEGLQLNSQTGLISGVTVSTGTQQVTVTASSESGTATGVLELSVQAALPVFLVQPANALRLKWGESAQLSASANGLPVPSYQWKLNGVVVEGGTGAALMLAPSAKAGMDRYTVVATNAAGAVESTVSTVERLAFTVEAPVLSVGGQSGANAPRGFLLGQPLALTAGFVGPAVGEVSAQWFRNGIAIAVGTGTTFARPAAVAADAGVYRVAMTSGGVQVWSPELRVEQGTPVVRIMPPGAVAAEGSSQTFTAVLQNGAVLGDATVEYVWKFKGEEVGRGASMTLSNVGRALAGAYEVSVTAANYGNTVERAVLQVSTLDIQTQPRGVIAAEGETVRLSVTALSSGGSISYQWRRDGTSLVDGPGVSGTATSALSLSGFSAERAGVYDVVLSALVASQNMSVTSVPAPVQLLSSVVIDSAFFSSQARRIRAGQALGLEVATKGGTGPFVYQWYKVDGLNEVALRDGILATQTVFGARSSRLLVTPLDKANVASGSYKVVINNGVAASPEELASGWLGGSRAESPWVLISSLMAPPSMLEVNSNAALPCSPGTQLLLSVSSFVDAAEVRYQWRRDGVPILNARSSTYAVTVNGADQTGLYDVVVSNDAGAVNAKELAVALLQAPAVLVSPLAGVTLLEGQRLEWTGFAVSGDNLQKTWSRMGGILPSSAMVSAGTLLIPAVSPSDSGTYTAKAANSFSEVTSSATLRVVEKVRIVSNPVAPALLTPGETVLFNVTAAGGYSGVGVKGGDLKYQWLRDGQPISGANDSLYALVSVSNGDDHARFSVRVSVQDGLKVLHSMTSPSVQLQVRQPVEITAQPESVSVDLNTSILLSVAASGSELTYQWRKDGIVITGEKKASLLLKVSETSAGFYDVIVGNAVNSVTSKPAKVDVRIPARITIQPVSKTVNRFGLVQFRVDAEGSDPLRFQWRKDGVVLADVTGIGGADTATISIASADYSNEGDYDVVVSNKIGTPKVSSVANLSISDNVKILTQPFDQTLLSGGSASFRVSVEGKGLRYQWRRNGEALVGAVYPVIVIARATPASAGDYDVLVTSGALEVASQNARLDVFEPVRLVALPGGATSLVPVNEANATASTVLQATAVGGSALKTWEWYRNGIVVSSGTGGGSSSFNVSAVDKEALYKVAVKSAVRVGNGTLNLGADVSPEVPVSLLQKVRILSEPVETVADAGASAILAVSAVGGGRLTYQWERERGGRWSSLAGVDGASLVLNGLRPSDAGGYRVTVGNARGGVTTGGAILSVREVDIIQQQPVSVRTNPGDTAVFNVTANGTNLAYQWRKDGREIAGATSARLKISSVSASDGGSYDAVVTHAYGTAISKVASLSVTVPPAIIVQPGGSSLALGSRVTLAVRATGTETLHYKWRYNSAPISGAPDRAFYLIENASTVHAGVYDVIVENEAGSETSAPALVNILTGVRIVQNPISQTTGPGRVVRFSVAATGSPRAATGSLSYRWRKDGVELADEAGRISGSSSETLVLEGVEGASAAATGANGKYDVVVSNEVNAMVSIPATLAVYSAPNILVQPQSLAVNLGDSARFGVTLDNITPAQLTWYRRRPTENAATRTVVGTGRELVLRDVSVLKDIGTYWVVAVNDVGEATSREVALGLLDILVPDESASALSDSVLTGPNDRGTAVAARVLECKRGARVSVPFTTVIPPQVGVELGYQWRFNGIPLTDGARYSGSQTRNLSLLSATDADAGIYDLVVTAASGGSEKARFTVRTTQLNVLLPPVVSSFTNLLVRPGQPVVFAPLVRPAKSGTEIKYQWFINGTLQAAATGGSYAIDAASSASAGVYGFAVSDDYGTTRLEATLAVSSPLSVAALPAFVQAESRGKVVLEAIAKGNPADGALRYQWRFDGVPIRGAVSSKFVLASLLDTQAGAYDVIVSNSFERVASTPCRIVVNVPWRFTSQPPSSTTVNPGETFSSGFVLSRTDSISVQWYRGLGRSSQILKGQTNASLNIAKVEVADDAIYFAIVTTPLGRMVTSPSRLVVNRPVVFTRQPPDQSVRPGASVILSAAAEGTGPLFYQWMKDGLPVPGATAPSFTLPSAVSADAGTYQLAVRNPVSVNGVFSSKVALLVTAPPVIELEPVDLKILSGGTFTLNVQARGEGTLSYQWRRNGIEIEGATLAAYTRAGVSVMDSGNFDCLVSNKLGTQKIGFAVTRGAVVRIFDPVRIIAAPQGRLIVMDGHASRQASFKVLASGTPPLVYTWTKIGALPGADAVLDITGDTLSWSEVTPADFGAYKVTVSGPLGDTATASGMILGGTSTAAFTQQPQAYTGFEGKQGSLRAVAAPGYTITKWQRTILDSDTGILMTEDLTTGLNTGTLTFAGLKTTDSGFYRAVALSGGSIEVESDSALLFVNAVNPLYEPSVRGDTVSSDLVRGLQTVFAKEGDDVAFPLLSTGQGLSFQWSKENGVLPVSARGGETATLSLRSVAPADAGVYSATVNFPQGDDTPAGVQSLPWTLIVSPLPKILADPERLQNRLPGEAALLSVAAKVTDDTTFQWFFRKPGSSFWVAVPGATVGSGTASTCVIPGVQESEEGEYRVEATNTAGTVVSESGFVNVYDPVKVGLAATAFVNPGGSLTLHATSTGALQDDHQYVFYRQLRTGPWEVLAKQASATLVLSNVNKSHQTSYKVRAFGRVNNAVESAPVNVTVNDPVAFTPITEVKTLVVAKGESVSFKAIATGSDVQFKWYLRLPNSTEWNAISGATTDTLSFASARPADAGFYGVRIFNAFSSAPPLDAVPRQIGELLVNAPPVANLAASVTGLVQASEGGSFRLTAELRDTGAGRLNYQWRRNGRAITGAGGSVLVFGEGRPTTVTFNTAVLTILDSGYYDVLVSSTYGAGVSGGVQLIVYPRPVIVRHPEAVLGSVGGTATFRAEVTGTGALTFSWERLSGGAWTAVQGGTQSVLSLKGLAVADRGVSYRLQVTSLYGGTVSNAAALEISDAGALTVGSPVLQAGAVVFGGAANLLSAGSSNLKLSSVVSDSSSAKTVSYRWRKDGRDVFTGTASRSGAEAYVATYTLPPVANETDGSYDLVVDNGAGFAGSIPITLVVDPRIEAFDVPASVNSGDGCKLTVSVRNASSGTYSYTWYRNGVGLQNGSLYSGATTSELTINAAPAAWGEASSFMVSVKNESSKAVMESGARVLNVLAPILITKQPASVSVMEGAEIGVSVAVIAGGAVQYQWLRDGVELVGEVASRLVRTRAALLDAGFYQVRISNAAGQCLSDVASVRVAAKLGVVVPAPDTVALGGGVNLVAQVSGAQSGDSLKYQWSRNGKKIPGAVSDQLRINSATGLDAGLYAVLVTCAASGETVTSPDVLLEVRKVPVVVVAPVSRVIVDGSGTGVNFAVVVSSESAVTYSWSKNGMLITGANRSNFRISAGTVVDAGQYVVRITNTAGSVEVSAKLTVLAGGSLLAEGATAGSSGTGFASTSWWAYWVDAKAALSTNDRNGYWLLERNSVTANGTLNITPGRSLWVWGSATKLTQALSIDEWAPSDQLVQDGVASDRNEFSVVADRLPAASYTLAGKLEGLGEAAVFGAPEVVKGEYNGDTEVLAVDLAWDGEQVAALDLMGTPGSLRDIEETLKNSLQRELATIAGE